MPECTADVVVIGAGPAGIAAATEAALAGARTWLLDENELPGGQVFRAGARREPPPAARAAVERLTRSGAHFEGSTTVFDLAAGSVRAHRGGELLVLATKAIVLCTGAIERFLPFPGWTLPGVVGVGAMQALLEEGLAVQGARVVVAGTGPLLVAVAERLDQHGAQVLAVLEQRSRLDLLRFGMGLLRWPSKLLEAARMRRSLGRVTPSAHVLAARGEARLEELEARIGGEERSFGNVDWLACGFGLVPHVHPALLAGCSVRDGRVAVDEWQRTDVEGIWCAGEPTGIGGRERAAAEGRVAGRDAAGDRRGAARGIAARDHWRRFGERLERSFAIRPDLLDLAREDTVVCRCEDVTRGELAGARDARDLKLRTRCGMGPCQGRICGPIVRSLLGGPADRVRPPLVPVPCSLLAPGSPLEED